MQHVIAYNMWPNAELLNVSVGATDSSCPCISNTACSPIESNWNVMAHGDAREGKWRGNWRMEWLASTLHTTSELGVSSITTADAHTSAASSGLNWRPCRFKWTRPFRRKTKSGFCACTITFQTQSTTVRQQYKYAISKYTVSLTYVTSWKGTNPLVTLEGPTLL
jgi:hypothetical protein